MPGRRRRGARPEGYATTHGNMVGTLVDLAVADGTNEDFITLAARHGYALDPGFVQRIRQRGASQEACRVLDLFLAAQAVLHEREAAAVATAAQGAQSEAEAVVAQHRVLGMLYGPGEPEGTTSSAATYGARALLRGDRFLTLPRAELIHTAVKGKWSRLDPAGKDAVREAMVQVVLREDQPRQSRREGVTGDGDMDRFTRDPRPARSRR